MPVYQDNEEIELSIVIPLFNEEENLNELIFVDDGSTDKSFDTLKAKKVKGN